MVSEAASRGTTVYLVDKYIDMLPALLGTNICSLRSFVVRPAFSTIWVSAVLFRYILLVVYDDPQDMVRLSMCASQNRSSLSRLRLPMRKHKSGKTIRVYFQLLPIAQNSIFEAY
jgi:hypothetical protein